MRRQETVTIDAEGRDKGKAFLITELPASHGERWAIRTFMALARSGVEVPEDVQTLGMAGIAALGFKAMSSISFEDAEPLLDEMMSCVQVVPEPSKPSVVRPLIEDDIEEVVTRLRLRREVFDLHTGFFSRAGRSTSTSESTKAGDS